LRRRSEKRYSNPGEEIKKRLEFELETIENMGFLDYFLIVWDFIRYARDNNIAVGPGRGSAAGSLVSYCLGITNIDRIKYGLIFERFLNPDRVTMPI
jgi:DNA polymerase-3 subunit alpha